MQALAETGDGLLWVGTTGGLASFGGFHLQVLELSDPQALAARSIFCLLADRDGSLWAGTEGGGLLHLRGDKVKTFSYPEGLTDGFVRSIFQDARGRLWVGTDNGLFRMDGERLIRFDDGIKAPHIAVHSIAGDRDGDLWVGGSQLLRITPSGAVDAYTLPGTYSKNRVKRILQTADGTVWVGTVGGLQRLVNGRFEPLASIHDTVRSLLQTSDGTLWIGTIGGGLWTLKDGVLARVNSAALLPSDTVLAMFQDNDGQIWMGTQAGLVRLNRTPVGILPLPGGGDPDFETVSGDGGDVWVAAAHLFAVRNGVATRLTFPGLEQISVRNVFRARDGAIWVGSDGSGAYRLSGRTVRHFSAPGQLTNNFIRGFTQSRDGAIWIATDEGVSRVAGNDVTRFTEASGLVYFSTRCLLEDRDGGVWIGTDRGVSLWQHGAFQSNVVTEALSREKVWSILQDRTGVLWFGTRDHGLFQYRDGRVQQFTTDQGLPSNSIYQVLQDRRGVFWLSFPDNIASVDESSMDGARPSREQPLSVASYAMPFAADGAQMYGGRQPAGFIAPDGTLWFPTSKGVAFVKEANHATQAHEPRAVINQMEEDGKRVDEREKLRVPAAVTRLTFSFGSIFLQSPAGVRFRYRLEPLEHTWNATDTEGAAMYTNLAAGRYRFRVQAFDAAHPQDISEAQRSFEKAPFYYQTWWFYALALLAAALAVWAVYRLRVRQMRTRFQAVLAERNRLAREMHDTVLQGCTGISALLEAMASKRDRPVDAELLEYARQQARSTIDEARQAVWDMRHDETQVDLLEAMRNLAEQTTREHGGMVTLQTAATSLRLGSSAAHELLMTVREAVYNAVQHSGSRRIELKAEQRRGELSIEVEDFGCGFDCASMAAQDGHFGMIGMRERMKRLGGRLELRSAPGAGTTVTLRLRHAAGLAQKPRSAEAMTGKSYGR